MPPLTTEALIGLETLKVLLLRFTPFIEAYSYDMRTSGQKVQPNSKGN